MKLLSLADLIGFKPQPEKLEITELDSYVYVRRLNTMERMRYQSSLSDIDDDRAEERGLKLILAAVVDDAGKPVFTAESLAALKTADGALVDRLFRAAYDANDFGMKELKKNSAITSNSVAG